MTMDSVMDTSGSLLPVVKPLSPATAVFGDAQQQQQQQHQQAYLMVSPPMGNRQHVAAMMAAHQPHRFMLGHGGASGSHSMGFRVSSPPPNMSSARSSLKRPSQVARAQSLGRAQPALQLSKMAFFVSPPIHGQKPMRKRKKTIHAVDTLIPSSSSTFTVKKLDFISLLPYELATKILSMLDIGSLAQVSLVSQHWHEMHGRDDVWRPKLVMASHNAGWPAVPGKRELWGARLSHVYQQRYQLDARWAQGRVATHYLIGHTDSVYCLQFDDHKVITGSRDRTIKIWDTQTYQCIRTLHGHKKSVLCLQFNDKIMVSGSSDNTLIVWDMATLEQKFHLKGHTGGVLDCSFDDKFIVSCSKDARLMVWDISTGKLLRVIAAHSGPVNGVQLHGDRIVSAASDALVKMWDVHTGACIRQFAGHTTGLACVQYNGKYIVSGSNDKTIRVWNPETGACMMVCEGHTDLVRTLHFHEDRIVSASYDQSVRVWDIKSGTCLLNFQSGHSSWVFDVHFDKKRIISASQDHTALVMDFSHGLDTRFL